MNAPESPRQVALRPRSACRCGQPVDPESPDWRFNGTNWQHYHGNPKDRDAARPAADVLNDLLDERP